MKTIIVPTDFSPAAINATNYAANLALATGSNLHLFNIYQIPVAIADVPLALLSVDDMQKAAEQKLRHLKRDLEHITSNQVNITIEARLGNVIDELADVCRTIDPFVVVMGSTGHSGIEKVLFGSTTLSAIKHLQWPVISVPKGKEYGNGIRKIGFACDLREVEETTPFSIITDFVKELHAEFHILNVEEEPAITDMPDQTSVLGTATMSVNPKFHFIKPGDIEDGINDFAETNNLDLIIAIPKKHKLVNSLFNPSSTRQLVSQSHIPVMCVHE